MANFIDVKYISVWNTAHTFVFPHSTYSVPWMTPPMALNSTNQITIIDSVSIFYLLNIPYIPILIMRVKMGNNIL